MTLMILSYRCTFWSKKAGQILAEASFYLLYHNFKIFEMKNAKIINDPYIKMYKIGSNASNEKEKSRESTLSGL